MHSWFESIVIGLLVGIYMRPILEDREKRQAEKRRQDREDAQAAYKLERIKARCDADPEFNGLFENLGPELAESYMNQRIAERIRFSMHMLGYPDQTITASADCSRNPSPN